MLKYFSLLILVVCLTSCFSETRTYIDYSIQNTSSSDIIVTGADIIHVRDINATIPPDQLPKSPTGPVWEGPFCHLNLKSFLVKIF